jgi:hypothetical protein
MVGTTPGAVDAIVTYETFVLDSTSPLILKMGNDVAVESATSVLREDITNLRIKEIDSIRDLDYPVKVAHAEVFYVGHGNQNGLQIGNDVVAWETMRGKIDSSPAVHHWVIACDSNNILRPKDRSITAIPGEIDAVVSSHIALAVRDNALTQEPNSHLQKAMEHYQDIQNGVTDKLPLALAVGGGGDSSGSSGGSSQPAGYWSAEEIIFAIIDFAIWFITTVAVCQWATNPIANAAKACKTIIALKFISIGTYLIRWAMGSMSLTALLTAIFLQLFDLCYTIILYLKWYLIGSILTVFIPSCTIGVPNLVFSLILAVGLLVYWGYHVVRDFNDLDGTYQVHT